jgi:Glycoside hydrolase family 44
MKKYALLFLSFLAHTSFAQLAVTYHINTAAERHTISPYIYGINNGVYEKATFRRWGGNRLSAYNWETNYSNAGIDYLNENDNYLPYVFNLPDSEYLKPGACIVAFHDTSLAQSAASAITLPMVGWVANDGAGPVDSTERAPSSRWAKVIDVKTTALSLTPDTTDDTIYVNEELNFITHTFGKAATATGVQNYIMDNEPGLWCSQFPDMRTSCVTYNELFTKSIALAGTVKNMDSSANVFGPEMYGFTDYWDLQFASDAGDYSSDHWAIDSYLKAVKHASDSESRRLLDVFSVHWYTQVPNVGSEDTTMATSIARMQCTRTLWDSTYVENSWITSSGYTSDLPIVPHIQHSINAFYPGTKFGITEYDYGGHGHISGCIAQTDVLGIFGNLGVDYASIWPALTGYLPAAFDLYRNYDGMGGAFGSHHVYSTSADTLSTIYAATEDTFNHVLHAIVTNKSYTNSVTATIAISSDVAYKAVDGYYVTGADTLIHHVSIPRSAISNDTLTYTLPPLSVYHFVLQDASALTVAAATHAPLMLSIIPNPTSGNGNITYNITDGGGGLLTIADEVGRILSSQEVSGSGRLSVPSLSPGLYFFSITDGTSKKVVRAVVTQ